MKKFCISILLLIVVILAIPMCSSISYALELPSESADTFRNPSRGFTKEIKYTLDINSQDYSAVEDAVTEIESNYENISLIEFKLDLQRFITDAKLTSSKVSEIQRFFDGFRSHGYKVLFNVCYQNIDDSDLESNVDMLLEHIRLLKPIFDKNKDIILAVEAGFLTNESETVRSALFTNSNKDAYKVLNKLVECVPEPIGINVDRVSYLDVYYYNNRFKNLADAIKNDVYNVLPPNSRLGIYHSSYLSGDTDGGAYERSKRSTILDQESVITKYTAFGGTVNSAQSQYTDFYSAMKDMKQRHATYLNSTNRFIDTIWQKDTFYNSENRKDVYDGKDGYKYIEDHLGYRLVIRGIQITEDAKKINVTLENVGFGNVIQNKKIEWVCKGEGKEYVIKSGIKDLRTCQQDGYIIISEDLKLPSKVKSGNYKIYLRLKETYNSIENNTKYNIRFANEGIWNSNIGANYICTTKDYGTVGEVKELRKEEKKSNTKSIIGGIADDKAKIEINTGMGFSAYIDKPSVNEGKFTFIGLIEKIVPVIIVIFPIAISGFIILAVYNKDDDDDDYDEDR